MNKTNLITNSLITLGLEENEGKGKGRYFNSRFIEAGIAHYDELGDILITKETLDKFIHTMVGCPVIINHKDVDDKNVDKLRVGVISKVWFNDLDGWYYCEGILTDSQAIDLIKNQGWSVSCSYNFVSDNQKKTYHGKEIDMEFVDGEFLHLAIVENPRYEGANIVVNSKTFDESKINRDSEGKFANKEGNSRKIEKSKNSPDCKTSPYYEEAKKIAETTKNPTFNGVSSNVKEQHENLIKKYPEANICEVANKKFGTGEEGEAVTIENENVTVIFLDEERSEKSNYTDQSWRSKIKNSIYLYTHEFGHALSDVLPDKFFDEINIIREEHNKNSEEYGPDSLDFISYRSMFSAPEFFAECFTYNELNHQNNKYVIKVMKIYDKYRNKINNNIKKKENLVMSTMEDLKAFILSVVNNACKNEVEEEKEKEVENEEEKDEEKTENEEDKKEEKAENKCKNEADDEEAKNEEDEKEKDIKEDQEVAENEEDEEEKKEVKNSMDKMNRIVMGGSSSLKEKNLYTSQAERLELGNEY